MQYRKLMEITDKELSMHKANCLTVRYEDFVSDSPTVINNILAFAGLGKSPAVETYMQGIKIYNQNKNESTTGKPVPHASEMERILQGSYAF